MTFIVVKFEEDQVLASLEEKNCLVEGIGENLPEALRELADNLEEEYERM